MQLLNAFSLQMLNLENGANISVVPANVWKDSFMGLYCFEDFYTRKARPLSILESKIGYPDLAEILGVEMNRVSSHLEQGEVALVAQNMGGRLLTKDRPTSKVEEKDLQFFWVKVN